MVLVYRILVVRFDSILDLLLLRSVQVDDRLRRLLRLADQRLDPFVVSSTALAGASSRSRGLR